MAAFFAEKFVASLNSYLGLMRHYNTYSLRRKTMTLLHPAWGEFIYFKGHFEVAVLKKRYRIHYILKKAARNRSEVGNMLTPELTQM